jgi:hypothetical protein
MWAPLWHGPHVNESEFPWSCSPGVLLLFQVPKTLEVLQLELCTILIIHVNIYRRCYCLLGTTCFNLYYADRARVDGSVRGHETGNILAEQSPFESTNTFLNCDKPFSKSWYHVESMLLAMSNPSKKFSLLGKLCNLLIFQWGRTKQHGQISSWRGTTAFVRQIE